MDDASERNKKGHRRSDRKQRHSMGFGHDRCNSSGFYLSTTHKRRKTRANKKKQQVVAASSDDCVNNEKMIVVLEGPSSVIRQISISSQSDTDQDPSVEADLEQMERRKSDTDIDFSIGPAPTLSESEGKFFVSNPVDKVFDSYQSSETIGIANVELVENNTIEYINNVYILEKCCEKTPVIDAKMIADLNKVLDNPSKNELKEIVCYVQNLPYDKNGRNSQVNQAVKSFRRKRSLTTVKLMSYLKKNIRKEILNRCSYGFFIINKDKDQFLAVRNCHGRNRWSAPKGHLKMKLNGQWEIPFEAASRETNEEIHYFDSKFGQWCTIDTNSLGKDDTYLECVLKDRDSEYRSIGLFIVCLQDDRKFYPKDLKEIDDVRWFPLQSGIDSQEFYTLYPFVEYVQNHLELLSR